MNFQDLRSFISFLEEKDDIKRIGTPVTWDLEITEIVDRTVKSGGPALLFENVEGYDIPLLINIFGTHQRTAWALGVEKIDDLTERVRKLLNLIHEPPSGLLNKAKTLRNLSSIVNTQPFIFCFLNSVFSKMHVTKF